MKTQQRIENCVACDSSKWTMFEEYAGYELGKCLECGLTFTVNPDYSRESYVSSYEDRGAQSSFQDSRSRLYSARASGLEMQECAYFLPQPRMTPSERLALSWFARYCPEGQSIIDCGCGTGRFLLAAKKARLQAVGVEVSSRLVTLLNRNGLPAIEGYAPDFPWDSPDPFSLTFFEVLEHLPNPMAVIQSLRERFPRMCIVASVPSPLRSEIFLNGERGLSDYPPHHFLRWTPKALEEFFKRAGFDDVQVMIPPPIGSELMPGLSSLLGRSRPKDNISGEKQQGSANLMNKSVLARTKSTMLIYGHRGYQGAMNVLGAPKAWMARKRGASASSMLVIARSN